MIINTKSCTPITGAPQEAIFRPNKYILQLHQGDQNKNADDNNDNDNNAMSDVTSFHQTFTPTVTPTKISVPGAPTKKRTNTNERFNRCQRMTPSVQSLAGRQPMTPTVKSTMISMQDSCKKKTKNREATLDGGRKVMYLPTIVYTPVQTSTRHGGDSPPSVNGSTTSSGYGARRLLSTQDMDELNARLEQLFIGCHSSHQADQENEKEEQEGTTASTGTFSTALGRVETTAFNYKTCVTAPVLRSARFQK
jgi:hypothetical protein